MLSDGLLLFKSWQDHEDDAGVYDGVSLVAFVLMQELFQI